MALSLLHFAGLGSWNREERPMKVPRFWLAAAVIAAGAVTLGARARRRLAGRRDYVRDVMVGDVVIIDASASLVDAALKMKEANIGILPVVSGGAVGEAMEVMAECQIGRLPVVNDEDQIVGMVTLSSLALRSDDRNDALHTAQEVSKRSSKAA